ncbi:cysteine desulfurase [Pelagibius litoralis]|uniref:cysteine desulfurase n=1 Tax=Pelagibius litoralis TaxID=374515 RepID=A0A967C1W7_9PROT|nr:cysteine desulfurase [Pelagibius litoralis]NIA67223.1 cysteine desulfurase [Pelagibius litoralis]
MALATDTLTEIGAGSNSTLAFDVERLREDFPILKQQVYGKPLVYLDSGSSSQKPRAVIDAMSELLETGYANVHRGAYYFSQTLTDRYEGVRKTVARFLNAASDQEIVFTRNVTEAINLVAHSFGNSLAAGDEVIITEMEHHANIVPWQLLRDRIGITLKVVPIAEDGSLRLDAYADMLTPRTRLVAITHVSNVLGSVNPMKEIIRLAHKAGALVLVDGAQAVVHGKVDVQDLDADFYAFTGHKLYGPTAIGVLYGKASLLTEMPPFLGGGDMIRSVSFSETTYADPPHRFEAGTPPIVEVIGLGAAIDYVTAIGHDAIAAHEAGLLAYATERLQQIDGLTIYGTAKEKAAIISFGLEGIHPHDIGTIIDREGVAIRVGHHCAQPLMECLGLPATARASFGLYNTPAEVDVLARALEKVKELFG